MRVQELQMKGPALRMEGKPNRGNSREHGFLGFQPLLWSALSIFILNLHVDLRLLQIGESVISQVTHQKKSIILKAS